jgi:hypothetical protein
MNEELKNPDHHWYFCFFSCKKRSSGTRTFYKSIMLSKFREDVLQYFYTSLEIKMLRIVRRRLIVSSLLKRGSKSFPYGLQKPPAKVGGFFCFYILFIHCKTFRLDLPHPCSCVRVSNTDCFLYMSH